MATRISDLVVCGELLNTRKNSVHGWLGLRGFKKPLLLALTGNAWPDLAGKHIRFKVRGTEEPSDGDDYESCECENHRLEEAGLPRLAWQQIGPTGTITAARLVRVADCPTNELLLRGQLGEPPTTAWKRCLTIEWFGQNGRMLVELIDPEIELAEGQAKSPPSGANVQDATAGQTTFDGDDCESDPDEDDDADEAGGSWDVVPADLQRELDTQARAVDRAINGQTYDDDIAHDMELMDELIQNSEGEPIGNLFDEVIRLPSPDSLDDDQAQAALQTLLARLAVHGIALDMCEHFSARDAYRLLIERVCQEERAYPELRGTQWVQHFSTWEYCKACAATFDREYEQD